MNSNLICVAKITKPHGIKGQAKLVSYTQIPEDIFSYPCLYDKEMKEYKMKMHSKNNDIFIISFNMNTSRNVVEEIAGTNLYVTRNMLPEIDNENEYYNSDLKGIKVLDTNKKLCGYIVEIHNFGAGDIIEMQVVEKKDTIFLPFNKDFVVETNIKDGYLIFDFLNSGIEYNDK